MFNEVVYEKADDISREDRAFYVQNSQSILQLSERRRKK